MKDNQIQIIDQKILCLKFTPFVYGPILVVTITLDLDTDYKNKNYSFLEITSEETIK
jgi:hypothetical protein